MKLKLSLDKHAIQQFFLAHVEKIVFGGIALCALLILYGAFGRDAFNRKPSDLMQSVVNTERHLDVDRRESVRKELTIVDYPSVAERSQTPILEQPYAHVRPWDRPVRDIDVRRVRPPLVTVRDLKAFGDRGALASAAGGMDVGGAPGQRFIVLSGVIPLREQYEEFYKAFSPSVYFTPEKDRPVFHYFLVDRAEIVPGRESEELVWEEGTTDKLRAAITRIGEFQQMPEPYPEVAVLRMTLPLPMRTDKPWPDEIWPEAIVGPSFERVNANLAANVGKEVTWQAESGIEQRTRVVFPYRRPGSDRDAAPSYFAVDYPTAELARQYSKVTQVTGIVDHFDTVTIPSEMGMGGVRTARVVVLKHKPEGAETAIGNDPKDPFGGLPGAGEYPGGGGVAHPNTMNEGGAAGGYGGESLPKLALLRYVDFDVKPGRLYVYRVRLVWQNPNFGRPTMQLLDPKEAEQSLIVSAPSAPTAPLLMPPDTHLLVLSVVQPARALEPTGKLAVVKWLRENGEEAFKDFSTWRGAVLNAPPAMFPPSTGRPPRPAGAGGALEGELPAPPPPARRGRNVAAADPGLPGSGESPRGGPVRTPMGIEPVEMPIVPTLVDYSTGAMTLDMRGTEPIPGRSRVTEVGETLVLDANGMLRVYNELEGKPEYERREAALKNRLAPPALPGAPGDPGLPGGGGLEGF